MRSTVIGAGLGLTLGTAVGLGGHHLLAAEKKEIYVPPAEIRTQLEKPLPAVDGKQMTIFHATLRPGFVGGKHYHTGPVYVYVLEGTFTIDEPAKPRRTFNAGELYEEPIGTPMQARNTSTTGPSRILVVQVSGRGEPLMYKAD